MGKAGITARNTPDKILDLLSIEPSMTLTEVARKLKLSLSGVQKAVRKLRIEGNFKGKGQLKRANGKS